MQCNVEGVQCMYILCILYYMNVCDFTYFSTVVLWERLTLYDVQKEVAGGLNGASPLTASLGLPQT